MTIVHRVKALLDSWWEQCMSKPICKLGWKFACLQWLRSKLTSSSRWYKFPTWSPRSDIMLCPASRIFKLFSFPTHSGKSRNLLWLQLDKKRHKKIVRVIFFFFLAWVNESEERSLVKKEKLTWDSSAANRSTLQWLPAGTQCCCHVSVMKGSAWTNVFIESKTLHPERELCRGIASSSRLELQGLKVAGCLLTDVPGC